MKFWVAGYEDQKSPIPEYSAERPATEIFESIFGKKKPVTPLRVRFDRFVIRQDSFEKGEAGESGHDAGSPRSHSPRSPASDGSYPPMLPSLQAARPTRMYSDFPHRPNISLRSGSNQRDMAAEPYNRASQMEEGKHLEHLERVAKRRLCVAICCAILLVVGIVLAATLPKRIGNKSTRGSHHTSHNVPAIPKPPAPHQIPTTFKCIATLTELYKAVDTYLVDESNSSHVARTYGHPIGSWCFNETLTDLTSVFSALRNKEAAKGFNANISGWDVSHVKNVGSLFRGSSIDQHLPWNTSQVTNMANLFRDSRFNSDISSWDVSKVVVFERMFQNAVFFDSGSIVNWNLSSALTTRSMFRGATSFRRDLCSWGKAMNGTVDVTKMFANTPNCRVNSPEAPVQGASSYGPFCFHCG